MAALGNPLSAAEVERFDRDGFLFPVRAANEATAARNVAAFDEMERRDGKNNHFGIGPVPLYLSEQWAWQLATSPTIIAALRQLLGHDQSIFCIASHAFCKYPDEEKTDSTAGPGAFVGWHQDLRFWGLEGPGHSVMGPHVVSAWTAIDDADTGNGCMLAVSGSYRERNLQHQKLKSWGGDATSLTDPKVNGRDGRPIGLDGDPDRGVNMLSQEQNIVLTEQQEKDLVPLELSRGESVLFHGWTVHGSPPNTSSHRRAGITIIYCTGTVEGAMASEGVLVAGDGVGANPRPVPPPFAFAGPEVVDQTAARL